VGYFDKDRNGLIDLQEMDSTMRAVHRRHAAGAQSAVGQTFLVSKNAHESLPIWGSGSMTAKYIQRDKSTPEQLSPLTHKSSRFLNRPGPRFAKETPRNDSKCLFFPHLDMDEVMKLT
jgi:hypothetical protein